MNWKGLYDKNPGYQKTHRWLRKTYGKACTCENDKCTTPEYKKFHWAKLHDKPYESDRVNFKMMCIPCHRKYDLTVEHKINISKSLTGIPASQAQKEKQSKSMQGKLNKPVIRFSLSGNKIDEFPSISIAAKAVGVSATAVYCALIKKTQKSGGYKWELKPKD